MAFVLSELFVPPSLACPALVDDLGMPRYSALIWAVIGGANIELSDLRSQFAGRRARTVELEQQNVP